MYVYIVCIYSLAYMFRLRDMWIKVDISIYINYT